MSLNNLFLDSETIINKDFYENVKEMLSCCICAGILINPKQCSTCENCFCSECIENWIKKSHTCPFKCSYPKIKEGGRMIKNLLEKLIFTCENKCGATNLSYNNKIEHMKICKNIKIVCDTCGAEYNENKINKKRNLFDELSKQYSDLRVDLKSLLEEKAVLKEKLRKLKNKTINRNGVLIDKCEHFYGNYKPIFICCNQAFPCYLCHDEEQFHHYEFSNKVLCLICGNIYQGSTCNICNSKQVYKKK